MENVQKVMDRIAEIQAKFHQFRVSPQNEPGSKEKTTKTDFKEKLIDEFKKEFKDEFKKESEEKKLNIHTKNSSQKEKIDRQIELSAEKYDVSKHLIDAVIKNESNYNPLAISPKGALGLMQLMPKTAEELNVTDAFNINENIDGGTKYLSQLLNRYNGDYVKAISAYNAGPSQVFDRVPNLKETKSYVKKVMNSYLQNMGIH